MNITKKAGRILVLAGLFVWMFCMAAFADTNCTVSVIGGSQLQPNAQVEVQVQVKAENKISDTDVFVTYDSQVLEYVSGDASESEAGKVRLRKYFPEGTTEHSWNLTFKAKGEGSTRMKAENCWIKHYDESAAGSSTASVMVEGADFSVTGDAVAAVATEVPNDTTTAVTPTEEAAQTTGEAMTEEERALQALKDEIANDGTMSCLVGTEKWMVQETFPDTSMPYHFQASTQFYKGVEVKAAKLTNAEYYLVYVKSMDGTQEKFVMYQGSTKDFFDIEKIQMNDQYVLYLVAPGEADIPSAFKETTLQIGTDELRAWQLENQTQTSSSADPSQFYIVCGYNQNGVGGWYLYDSGLHSFQRYVELTSVDYGAAADAESTKWKNNYNQLAEKFDFMVECLKYVSIILIAFLLLLLIVNITDKSGVDKTKKLSKKEKKAMKQAEKAKRKEEKARRKEEERMLLSDEWDEIYGDEEEAVSSNASEKEVVKAPAKEVVKETASGVEMLKPVKEGQTAKETATATTATAAKAATTATATKAATTATATKAATTATAAKAVTTAENAGVKNTSDKEFSITASMEELSRQIQEAMNEDHSRKPSFQEDLDDLQIIDLDD